MNYLEKIYLVFHKLLSKPQERGMYSAGYWQSKVRENILTMLSQYQGRLLEIGCGEGLFLSQFVKAYPQIQPWGVDCWTEALIDARKRFIEKEIKRVSLVTADAQRLPFKDSSFDSVVCANFFICVESLSMVRSVLQEAARVCRKNAALIIEFRNKKNIFLNLKYKWAKYYDTTTQRHPLSTYDKEEIVAMLKEFGFALGRIQEIDFPFKGMAAIFILEAKKVC